MDGLSQSLLGLQHIFAGKELAATESALLAALLPKGMRVRRAAALRADVAGLGGGVAVGEAEQGAKLASKRAAPAAGRAYFSLPRVRQDGPTPSFAGGRSHNETVPLRRRCHRSWLLRGLTLRSACRLPQRS